MVPSTRTARPGWRVVNIVPASTVRSSAGRRPALQSPARILSFLRDNVARFVSVSETYSLSFLFILHIHESLNISKYSIIVIIFNKKKLILNHWFLNKLISKLGRNPKQLHLKFLSYPHYLLLSARYSLSLIFHIYFSLSRIPYSYLWNIV